MLELRKSAYGGAVWAVALGYGVAILPNTATGKADSEGLVPVDRSGHILRWQASPGMPLVHALFENQSPRILESAILLGMAIGAWARDWGKHTNLRQILEKACCFGSDTEKSMLFWSDAWGSRLIWDRLLGKQANLGQMPGKGGWRGSLFNFFLSADPHL